MKSLKQLGSQLDSMMDRFVGYEKGAKRDFINTARRFLRRYAKEVLKLDEKGVKYKVSANRAGVAVSGDVILHAEDLYVNVSVGFSGQHVFYRTCKGMKDYGGGRNMWTTAEQLATRDVRTGAGDDQTQIGIC